MKKFIQEFKQFAFKGNVFDMAIGVVIGGAFSKIVTSMVSDIIMPLVSMVTGSTSFASMSLVIGTNADGTANTLNYGMFIQNVVDFLIVAFCIFVCIKLISKAKRKEEKVEETTPAPDPQLVLLEEIRDLLKENQH